MFLKTPNTLEDFRILARRRLPRHLFDFIDSGSFREHTIRENARAFDRIYLNKRVLRNVSTINTQTEVLGKSLAFPLILAPIGFTGTYARRGEVQAARAAEKGGIPFCLSSVSICSIEEVQASTTVPFWFQLYMIKDRTYCRELLQRAHAAGCPALLFTVDLPVVGVRYRDIRHGMARSPLPPSAMTKLALLWQYLSHPHWFYDVVLRGGPLVMANFVNAKPELRNPAKLREWVGSQLDAGMTWKDFDWVRAEWPGKLILKGVLNPEDARLAVQAGADGLVVSNHAGRHLDSTPPTISVLPSIVEAVEGRLDIFIDGGISSGLDIIKALALGAKACLIGRPWAFALASRGEQGISEMIAILRHELEVAMAHLGVSNIKEIDRSVILD